MGLAINKAVHAASSAVRKARADKSEAALAKSVDNQRKEDMEGTIGTRTPTGWLETRLPAASTPRGIDG